MADHRPCLKRSSDRRFVVDEAAMPQGRGDACVAPTAGQPAIDSGLASTDVGAPHASPIPALTR